MQVIHAESVSHALSQALVQVNTIGIKEQSRVGDVLVFPTPVTTVYHNPRNRVLWSPLRNAAGLRFSGWRIRSRDILRQ